MNRRKFLTLTGLTAGAVGVTGYSFRCAFSAPPYEGMVSEYFDGERFINPRPFEQKGFLKWMLNRERGHWNAWTEIAPQPKPPERVGNGELRVTFINHATVLIQMDGFNILTDPIWSERASPFTWTGPIRHKAPGIAFEDLPPIDVVLVSHNHYDHMDIATLKRLSDAHHAPTFVTLGNRDYLEPLGITMGAQFGWWESRQLRNDMFLHCVPAQHFSARGLCDRDRTLWSGYVIQSKHGNIYFAGDTGWGPHFEQIAQRLGPFRLAMLPIGAFRPRWFMSGVHMDPEEAIRAHRVLNAAVSVPIHHGTFHLGDDGEDEPVEELRRVLESAEEPKPNFLVLAQGEGRDLPAVLG